jgi:hypothetical protein
MRLSRELGKCSARTETAADAFMTTNERQLALSVRGLSNIQYHDNLIGCNFILD